MPDKDAPKASSDAARKRMKATRQRETKAELLVRSELHSRGLRYRIHRLVLKDVQRRVDIVFHSKRVAVFIDGCFWHGCPSHGTYPKKNREYWEQKIERNIKRDRDTDRRLKDEGWLVVRIWEHEDPKKAADRVEEAIRSQWLFR